MKKYFLFPGIVLSMLILFNQPVLQAQTKDDPYVLLSEYTLNEDNIDEAIDLLSDLQLKTLENEPGCIAFDVLLSEEDTALVFIYKSFENEQAYNSHIKKSYYIDIVTKKLKPFIKKMKAVKVFPLNYDGMMFDADF